MFSKLNNDIMIELNNPHCSLINLFICLVKPMDIQLQFINKVFISHLTVLQTIQALR